MAEDAIDFATLAQMAGMDESSARLQLLMMPHVAHRQVSVLLEGSRFVHYTSAEAAVNIIRSKQIWLRKVVCMNDLSEVHYGTKLLHDACSPERYRDRILRVLDQVGSDIGSKFDELWSGWLPHLSSDTYVLCLSEHVSSEDNHGRLSMWRAYGRSCGIALVLKTSVFATTKPEFGAFTSPVSYFSDEQFFGAFEEIVRNMEANVEFLKTLGTDAVIGALFNAFRALSITTKHPAFLEEREWRVIHSPKMFRSKYIEQAVAVINGVPQPVCKIGLTDVPEMNLVGASIPALLDRVIIGPTDYALATWEAFVELLREAGVEGPENKVILSGIPLRPT